MLEYSADAAVKSAMARAHAERGKVLKNALKLAWTRLFGARSVPALRPKISRWA
ncbi:hypothetical protein J4729_02720 [Leisingera sp. HS039]|uniref:hypothetical protein n=1 Tax=unclassified Leisingera TaxID=2614906 RepID=UPI00142F5747|nr:MULTISPECIES: hypothetical protein [unclassified Leisingera]MBQ4823469.1 hypothetical protein [Leisingera sp. HS039]